MRLFYLAFIFIPTLALPQELRPFEEGESLTVRVISARRITNREYIESFQDHDYFRRHPQMLVGGWEENNDNVRVAAVASYESFPKYKGDDGKKIVYYEIENGMEVRKPLPTPFGPAEWVLLKQTQPVHLPPSPKMEEVEFSALPAETRVLHFPAPELNSIHKKMKQSGHKVQRHGILVSVRNYCDAEAKKEFTFGHYTKDINFKETDWQEDLYVPFSELKSQKQRYRFMVGGCVDFRDDVEKQMIFIKLDGAPVEVIVEVDFERND